MLGMLISFSVLKRLCSKLCLPSLPTYSSTDPIPGTEFLLHLRNWWPSYAGVSGYSSLLCCCILLFVVGNWEATSTVRKSCPKYRIMIFMEICLQHARTPLKFKFCHTLRKTKNFLRLTFPYMLIYASFVWKFLINLGNESG